MAQTKVKLISNGVITVDNLHTNHGITTDHIGEGTNKFFTDARVQSFLTTNNYITNSDVANLETLTSLSLAANTLSYVDEAGNTTNLDLSLYLDDTNLARLVSGSLDGGTGVATFTRDDSSTFTVDFSAFLSDANDYVSSASFNTSDGVLTLTRFGGGTVTVDLDNRYLTSFTETDPVFTASAASGITSTNISNWNTAYGWGNHASAGYQSASSSFFKPFDELGSAVNLNNFRTTGYASQNTNSHAAAGSNYPTPNAGMFEVVNDDTGNGVHATQRYARYNTNDFYARNYYNGSWTSWTRFLTTSDEGPGNGLDADTVDGLQASSFLRSDTANSFSGTLSCLAGSAANGIDMNNADIIGLNWLKWDDDGEGLMYPDGESFYWSGSLWQFTGGYIEAQGSMRSPIFYDSNDTGYYVDPASTSLVNAVRFGTTAGSWGSVYVATSNNSGWSTGSYPHIGSTGGSSGSLIMIHNPHIPFRTDNARTGASGRSGMRCAIDTAATAWWDIGLTGDAFEIFRGSSSTQMLAIDSSGNNVASGSMRAPIFYDSNNTGYYADPASTSNFNQLNAATVYIGGGVYLQESADRADLLQISSNTSGWGGLQIRNTSNEGRWSFMTDGEAAGIYNDEDNQWHIYMVEGQGVSLRYASSEKFTTTSGGISVTGAITASGDITAFSDERTKENIKTIDNPLDKIKNIRGVVFNKIGEKEESIGVIAQEIEKTLPQVVRSNDEGMKSVAYGNITALLIEAIKEQQQQIEELKALINK